MVSSFTYPLSFSITMEKLKVYQKYFEWDFRFEKDHRDHSVQLAEKNPKRMSDIVLGHWNLLIKQKSS